MTLPYALYIPDPANPGKFKFARGADGRLVGLVEGVPCPCCGTTNDPSCCFFSDLEFGCGANVGPWCCNWGAELTYETQGEYHDTTYVDGVRTFKNDWLERRKSRYFVDVGSNGECRGYY